LTEWEGAFRVIDCLEQGSGGYHFKRLANDTGMKGLTYGPTR